MKRLLAALVLLASCGGEEPVDTGPAPRPVPVFSDVIVNALTASAPVAESAPAAIGTIDEDELRGLIATFSSSDKRFADAAREDVRKLPAGISAALVALFESDELNDEERTSVIGLLGARADKEAVVALLHLVEQGEPAWVRTHAAWRLGETGADSVLPRLLLRLKYETERDTIIWIADTLGKHGNFAAGGVLERIGTDPAEEQAARYAAGVKLIGLRDQAGIDETEALSAAWLAGRIPVVEHTQAYDHAIWQWIKRLEEYQLRGVDDARFLLERSDSHTAQLLGEALGDQNRYVRVHACQCLARMGARARVAEAELIELLGDPLTAHESAAALGRLNTASAETELLHEVQHAANPEIQITAARALRWRLEEAGSATRELLRQLCDEPGTLPELRQAALETRAYLDELDRPALGALCGFCDDQRFEADTSIRALTYWLAQREDTDLHERFLELAPTGGEVISFEERRRSRGARAQLVRDSLDELFGSD